MEKKEKKKTNLTKTSLILRVMVSLYLSVYRISAMGFRGNHGRTDKIIVIVAMVIFTGIAIPLGGLLCAMSQGNYQG